jgi:hypothetical protein
MSPDFFTELFKKGRIQRPKSRDHFVETILVVAIVTIFGVVTYTLVSWLLHHSH